MESFFEVTWNNGGFESFGEGFCSETFNTLEEAKAFAKSTATEDLNKYGLAPNATIQIFLTKLVWES